MQSPYEISFELNRAHNIKGIIIKGYGENASWAASNGTSSEITVSTEEFGKYESVGTIPSTFSNTPITIEFKKSVTIMFIKVQKHYLSRNWLY